MTEGIGSAELVGGRPRRGQHCTAALHRRVVWSIAGKL